VCEGLNEAWHRNTTLQVQDNYQRNDSQCQQANTPIESTKTHTKGTTMSAWRQKMMKALMKSGPTKPIIKPAAREAESKTRWNIVRGDRVQIIGRHPESGKQGIVREMIRSQDRVVVEGINLKAKRIGGTPERGIKGRTVMREQAVHYSNVSLVDPVTNTPTRIVRKILEDGTKVRVAKGSGAIIPKPEVRRKSAPNSFVSKDCTLDDAVWEITYPHYKHNTEQTPEPPPNTISEPN
jgi:large subunit ribosomal protein L24